MQQPHIRTLPAQPQQHFFQHTHPVRKHSSINTQKRNIKKIQLCPGYKLPQHKNPCQNHRSRSRMQQTGRIQLAAQALQHTVFRKHTPAPEARSPRRTLANQHPVQPAAAQGRKILLRQQSRQDICRQDLIQAHHPQIDPKGMIPDQPYNNRKRCQHDKITEKKPPFPVISRRNSNQICKKF